jgi:ABC-type cobalamin/Fe3+-siderophores transport system ATPase subunit
MQALASKASATLGVAFGVMLSILGGIALLGFGLYVAAQLLLEGIYDVLGEDLATFLFALVIVCAFAVVACGLIALCARLGAWIYGVGGRIWSEVKARQEDTRLARVDAQGIPPLPRQLVEDPHYAAALLALVYQGIEAKKPPSVPQTLTYAPHLRYSNDVQGALAEASAPVLDVKDFWSLFTGGHLPEQGFLMGYSLDDGQPVLADWRNLYSVLIGGQSGTGKSTLIRNILAQSALQGGRFLVLDPHYGAGEESLGASLQPLQSRMIAEPASSDAPMLDAMRYVASAGRNRLQGKDKDKTPLILVVDELTALLQRSGIAGELTATLGQISQETRKVGVFCLAIGQQFSSEVMSTPVRNSFVSYVTCRTRRDVARVMSGSNLFGKAAETLTTGQAVWMTPAGEFHRLAVPNTTQRHMQMVAQTLASPEETAASVAASPAAAPVRAARSRETPLEAVNEVVDAVGSVFDPRAARVRQLILENKSAKEIIGEVWGATGGDKYRKASAEYQAIVQQLIR